MVSSDLRPQAEKQWIFRASGWNLYLIEDGGLAVRQVELVPEEDTMSTYGTENVKTWLEQTKAVEQALDQPYPYNFGGDMMRTARRAAELWLEGHYEAAYQLFEPDTGDLSGVARYRGTEVCSVHDPDAWTSHWSEERSSMGGTSWHTVERRRVQRDTIWALAIWALERAFTLDKGIKIDPNDSDLHEARWAETVEDRYAMFLRRLERGAEDWTWKHPAVFAHEQ